MNKKEVSLFITEKLIGSASTLSSITLAISNPTAGFITTSAKALLTSIAFLSTNEYISKLKTRYTNLRDWIKVFTLLYDLKKSMIDKKIDERRA